MEKLFFLSKRRQEKRGFFLNFFGQKLLTWTSSKKFLMVFLNSFVVKRTKKRHKKNLKKNGTCLPHLVAICQMYVAYIFFPLRHPLCAGYPAMRLYCAPEIIEACLELTIHICKSIFFVNTWRAAGSFFWARRQMRRSNARTDGEKTRNHGGVKWHDRRRHIYATGWRRCLRNHAAFCGFGGIADDITMLAPLI
jgi:hypothetical protein